MNYCFYTIGEYMDPKQVIKMNKNFVLRFFPRSVNINGLGQLRTFHRLCETFDTSRLEEVRIMIEWESQNIDNVIRVPVGVRKVSLDVNRKIRIELPDTVEELTVVKYPYYQYLYLPDSIRKLTLGKGFNSIVWKWSENLVELHLYGWCSGNGRTPVPIDWLPASLKRLTLNNDLDIEFGEWPEGIEEVVYL
jgi:hypothetical protein